MNVPITLIDNFIVIQCIINIFVTVIM
jgi:hypothetical protein